MLTVLWSGTFLNFLSTQTSGWVSTVGIITGSIIPGIAIIGLGTYWLASDQVIQIEISRQALLPDFSSLSSFAYFTAIALGFAGIEVAAFYVQDTQDPQRTFPIATFIAACIIITIYVLGALTIAVVIPKDQMNLSAGMMQAMTKFFQHFNIPWATPWFAMLSVIGGLALLNTWIIGPSKGLLTSAQHNHLPAFAKRVNLKGSPVAILLMQAFIGSILISLYLFIPTMNQFYWIFQTLAAQLILMMYLMIFFSVIKLRYSQPHTYRRYKIPGGKVGVWLVAGTGALFCIAAFLLGFMPPDEYRFIHPSLYTLLLLGGIVLFCAPPFVWEWHRRRQV